MKGQRACKSSTKSPLPPRVRDLPSDEQGPFWNWLTVNGQTRPAVEGVPDGDQDFYFPHDYDDWKSEGRRDLINER